MLFDKLFYTVGGSKKGDKERTAKCAGFDLKDYWNYPTDDDGNAPQIHTSKAQFHPPEPLKYKRIK